MVGTPCIGQEPSAEDSAIMEWVRAHEYTVFTHDLDFGTLLTLTHARGPSVIQIRTQDTMPEHLENLLMPVLRQYKLNLSTAL